MAYARGHEASSIALSLKGHPNMTTIRPVLPPDPEGLNEDRAEWAEHALAAFMAVTGTDTKDALSDLLCNLIHWSDRHFHDFHHHLERAKRNYAEETMR